MAQPTKRRGHGEDAIYWDESKGRGYGSGQLGFDSGGKRLRRKVSGRTKTEVKDKSGQSAPRPGCGGRPPPSGQMVDQAVADWMRRAGTAGQLARCGEMSSSCGRYWP